MSAKNKLQKFAEMRNFGNVFQNFTPKAPSLVTKGKKQVDYKGNWRKAYFHNEQAIILELACGKGDYAIGLSAMYPDKNFIGIDVKGSRIWKGASRAIENNQNNVAFLRTRIEQITAFFAPGEIDEIWITFPDPFLKKRKINRRLTSPAMLERYRDILKPSGWVHLKTDSPELYEFTLEVIKSDKDCTLDYYNNDIYASQLNLPELEIKTFYEKMHLAEGKTIKYVRFNI